MKGAPVGKKPVAPRARKSKPDLTPGVRSIKGFNADWTCRGYQFAVGGTYEHKGAVKACEAGFHAIEGHPLDVFKYYPPSRSVYAETLQSGEISRDGGDSKIASARITVVAEITLPDLIQRAVDWVFTRAKTEGPIATGRNGLATASGNSGAATASGYSGAATASGDSGAATASGDSGAATASGDSGAATASGYSGAATASGYSGAATASGYRGAATASGDSGAATASGYSGAATASGDSGAATASGNSGAATASGDSGAATASGDSGAATASGNRGAATASGYSGAATASGRNGQARGAEGCAIFLVYRDKNWKITHAWAGIVGHDGIKPMVWYSLNEHGDPVEVHV